MKFKQYLTEKKLNKKGDIINIGLSGKSKLIDEFTDDMDVSYQLWKSLENDNKTKAVIRLYDTDANDTVSHKGYPDFMKAKKEYDNMIKKIKRDMK